MTPGPFHVLGSSPGNSIQLLHSERKPPAIMAVLLLLCGILFPPRAIAAELFPFVIPWDDAAANATSLADRLPKPAGAAGPVTVRDGQLFAGTHRFQICGVNLCFRANFPERDTARKLAARLAKLGVNCVRLHHMDMFAAPDGIFVNDNGQPAADWRLDPEQLRRMDGLIAELKAVGVSTNLNLHVSRRYAPEWPGGPTFGKGVDQFVPELIELQKQYARDLLTHRNPDTGNSYASEPAVAIVEINNENALSHEWQDALIDDAPAAYQAVFSQLWTSFLRQRYPDTAALAAAWNAQAVPLGAELLTNGDFSADRENWFLEQHEGAEASLQVMDSAAGGRALQVQVQRIGTASWHVQFMQPGFAVEAGQAYRVRISGRSLTGPQTLQLVLSQNHEPWQPLADARVTLSQEQQTFERLIISRLSDDQARLVISGLGESLCQIEVDDVSLRSGGLTGLPAGEGIGENETVSWIKRRDWSSRTSAVQQDWIDFLWEAERAYWSQMRRFVKDELGVQATVLGTQLGWSPFPIQAEFDILDTHAYWQHPEFPGAQWDSRNWRVRRLAMSDAPDGGLLSWLARHRVVGKPLICTEYNHPAPNPYASEGYPLIFAQAGQQSWDGVFAFSYSHDGEPYDTQYVNSFFDIDQNPVQLVGWTAGALAYRFGGIPTRPPAVRTVSLADLKRHQQQWGVWDPLAGDSQQAMRQAIAVTVGEQTLAAPVDSDPRPAFDWQPGRVQLHAPRSHFWIGRFDGQTVPGEAHQVTFGSSRLGWSAVTLNVLAGDDLVSAKRLLITATGDYANTEQQWTSPAQESVGEAWGRAPSLVEGIAAEFTLPYAAKRVMVFALDGRGERTGPVAVQSATLAGQPDATSFKIGPEHRTLWYEVEIAGEP